MSVVEPEAPLEGTPPEPEQEPLPDVEDAQPADEQPRDDQGRFMPKDPRAQQLLEKYGGDPEKALAAAVDAQELIGRQASELGDLRQLRDRVEQQQAQYTPEQISAYAEQDPQQAVLLAYQQYGRGSAPYETALRAWGDLDPFTAARFDGQAAVADYDRQVRPQLQQAELSNGLNQIIQKYPDFAEYGDAILREAQNSPVVRALQAQGAPISADVIEHLYLAARGRAGLAQTAAHNQDAEAARQQKLTGGVASATAARPNEPPPRSEDDEFKQQFAEQARRMGYSFASDE